MDTKIFEMQKALDTINCELLQLKDDYFLLSKTPLGSTTVTSYDNVAVISKDEIYKYIDENKNVLLMNNDENMKKLEKKTNDLQTSISKINIQIMKIHDEIKSNKTIVEDTKRFNSDVKTNDTVNSSQEIMPTVNEFEDLKMNLNDMNSRLKIIEGIDVVKLIGGDVVVKERSVVFETGVSVEVTNQSNIDGIQTPQEFSELIGDVSRLSTDLKRYV